MYVIVIASKVPFGMAELGSFKSPERFAPKIRNFHVYLLPSTLGIIGKYI